MREILVYDDYEIHKLGAGGGTEYEEVTTEKATSIYVTDVAKPKGKLIPFGRTTQNGEPTPENPIPIENVEGNIVINVCNKNLWGGFTNTRTAQDVTFTHNIDGTITITGTAKGNCYSISSATMSDNNWFKTLKQGKYTLSGGINSNIKLQILDSSANTLATSTSSASTFTIVEETQVYIRAYISSGTVTNVTLYPQLEQGSTATPYEEHKEQTILFPLAENQKLMEEDYLADDGVHHVRGQVTLDGTETWNLDSTEKLVRTVIENIKYQSTQSVITNAFSTYFSQGSINSARTNLNEFTSYQRSLWFNRNNMSVAEWKTWLSTNHVTVEYELREEVIESYTPAQAEAYSNLKNLLLYKGVNHIWTETDGLEPNLQLTYKRKKQSNVLQVSSIQSLNNLELNNTEETPAIETPEENEVM